MFNVKGNLVLKDTSAMFNSKEYRKYLHYILYNVYNNIKELSYSLFFSTLDREVLSINNFRSILYAFINTSKRICIILLACIKFNLLY